jgi:hypothetical protein
VYLAEEENLLVDEDVWESSHHSGVLAEAAALAVAA